MQFILPVSTDLYHGVSQAGDVLLFLSVLKRRMGSCVQLEMGTSTISPCIVSLKSDQINAFPVF